MSTERARHLRRIATPAEKRLWYHLRNRRLQGLKFRRQEPIGTRIVDFYCAEVRLAIELDGSGHTYDEALASDAAREAELKAIGIRVLRFFNSEIDSNLDGVLNAIIYAADPKRSLWPPVTQKEDATFCSGNETDPHLILSLQRERKSLLVILARRAAQLTYFTEREPRRHSVPGAKLLPLPPRERTEVRVC